MRSTSLNSLDPRGYSPNDSQNQRGRVEEGLSSDPVAWVAFALAGVARLVSAFIFFVAFGIRRTDEQGGPPIE